MEKFAPYILDGCLHLPKITLDALVPHGIDLKTAQRIRRGVPLTDTDTLYLILCASKEYTVAAPDSPITSVLHEGLVQSVLGGGIVAGV